MIKPSSRKSAIVERKANFAQKKGGRYLMSPSDTSTPPGILPAQNNQNLQGKVPQQQAKELRVATRNRISQAYFNLKDSAQYLGIGESTAKREWPGWQRYGVVPARFPGRTLRFKRSDLDRMMESLKVVEV